ncbi:hypothetical protein A1D31_36640 [Bradyrhizobium liaoningense]|nr:hypothetical protein A1D31_36640 [Bradyrhizobium liaoningense]
MIDDHRDRSSDDGIQRFVLKRMAAEICLARVGPVYLRDLALYRNSQDSQQLIETCPAVKTLLLIQAAINESEERSTRSSITSRYGPISMN